MRNSTSMLCFMGGSKGFSKIILTVGEITIQFVTQIGKLLSKTEN